MRLYPLSSVRDWQDACERSQERANRQRSIEPTLTLANAIESVVFAVLLVLFLVCMRAIVG